jgi:hypothetical protein
VPLSLSSAGPAAALARTAVASLPGEGGQAARPRGPVLPPPRWGRRRVAAFVMVSVSVSPAVRAPGPEAESRKPGVRPVPEKAVRGPGGDGRGRPRAVPALGYVSCRPGVRLGSARLARRPRPLFPPACVPSWDSRGAGAPQAFPARRRLAPSPAPAADHRWPRTWAEATQPGCVRAHGRA